VKFFLLHYELEISLFSICFISRCTLSKITSLILKMSFYKKVCKNPLQTDERRHTAWHLLIFILQTLRNASFPI